MVRTQDIRSGVFRFENAARVSEDTYRERTRTARPSFGDLLYSREGTYFGIAAEVPPNTQVCLGQRMVLIKPDPDKVHYRFLRYWLNSPMLANHVNGNREGSVAERLNLPIIRALPILVPPLSRQQTIAAILGALDDKIELNRRMNATLEAMARAIFTSWFVDFDPVHAKMEGRQPFGMDADTAALFPESFEDSLSGAIPYGWQLVAFADIATHYRDGINPYAFPDETFDHYSLPAFDQGRMPANDKGEAIKSNKFNVPPNGVLVSKLNPRFPRVWLPNVRLERRAISSTEFLVLVPKQSLSREYLYELCSTDSFRASFASFVTGTSSSHQRVNPESLLTMPIVLPPENVLRAFTVRVKPILQRVRANLGESFTLFTIRDTMLPKLIGGELRMRGI